MKMPSLDWQENFDWESDVIETFWARPYWIASLSLEIKGAW